MEILLLRTSENTPHRPRVLKERVFDDAIGETFVFGYLSISRWSVQDTIVNNQSKPSSHEVSSQITF